MSTITGKVFFAPELFIKKGITDISFYERAFGAVIQLRFNNDDGSLHVAELSIGGTIFHLHEETDKAYFFATEEHEGTTVCIGLFVENVDAVIESAVAAGALIVDPAQDYDYGYRQGTIKDPFGHYWQVQKKI